LADQHFAESLRQALQATAAVATLATPAPLPAALETVVATAMQVIGARAASLYLVDEARDELIFAVALGGRAEQLLQRRLPIGHGIAGYVAATGQPLAIADPTSDPRFAREIAEAVNYLPQSILCFPLVLAERVVGVLQLLDKEPSGSFSLADMHLLGQFAQLAALTVEQAQTTQVLRHLFTWLVTDLAQGASLAHLAPGFAERSAATAEQAEVLRLAGLVVQVSRHGPAGRQLAIDLLTALGRYQVRAEPPRSPE
jgi:GAF domain-containing protein